MSPGMFKTVIKLTLASPIQAGAVKKPMVAGTARTAIGAHELQCWPKVRLFAGPLSSDLKRQSRIDQSESFHETGRTGARHWNLNGDGAHHSQRHAAVTTSYFFDMRQVDDVTTMYA